MPKTLRLRLSAMMFLQYFVMGATIPILSLYLKNHLGFGPIQVGVILATGAAGFCAAPFMDALFAGRLLGAERFLAVTQFLAAAVMFILSRQSTFPQFWAWYAAYAVIFMPSVALTNAVAFQHVSDSARGFGGIRMWGTAGWFIMGWVFGYGWLGAGGALRDALVFSAAASMVYGCYALTLPRSRPAGGFGLGKAFKLLVRPDMLLLCVLTFVASAIHQYFYYGMSPFLSYIGFAERSIMPVMSLGQLSEAIVLGVLGICLAKLGIKRAMIIGLLAQTLRFAVFACCRSKLLMVAVMPTHGVCYAFFFTAAYIYVDQHSTPETRSSAQQLYTILITGTGPLVGSLFAGHIAAALSDGPTIHYRGFWLVPAALALCTALAVGLFFRETKPEPPQTNN